MKENQTILSLATTSCGQHDGQQVHCFGSPAEALRFIEDHLREELALARKHHPSLTADVTEGDPRTVLTRKEGSFSYAIGTNGYHFAFLNTAPEYAVTDDEAVAVLGAFVNTGRTQADYDRVAQRISAEVHRHTQNELWRFVKALVRAFASGGHDRRNQTAWAQSCAIAEDMDLHGI